MDCHLFLNVTITLQSLAAGLFGLTAACDLAKKGYQVTVFEKSGKFGGTINQIPDINLAE